MNQEKDNRIAVVIPCLNEEATVGKVVRDVKKFLPSAAVYVFDNNSTDKTSEYASDAGAVVIKENRRGKGYVIRSIFKRIDADIYILVDGDDTYSIENVGELIKPLLSDDADMVIGDRLSSSYFTENKRRFHNSGNRLVRWLINRLFNASLHDVLSGYRAFNHDFVKNFPAMSRGFEIETEMTVFALEKDFRIVEIAIPYRDRAENSISKLNTVSDGLRVLTTLMMLFRDYRPLLFFSMVSLVTMLIGLTFFIPVLIEYWNTGLVPRFPTLIGSCFIMLFGLMLFLVGLLLDVSKRHKDELFRLLLQR